MMDYPQDLHLAIPSLSLEQFNTPYFTRSWGRISLENEPKRCSSHSTLFWKDLLPPLLLTSKSVRYLKSELKSLMSLSKSKWMMRGAWCQMNSLIRARSSNEYPKCSVLASTSWRACRWASADCLWREYMSWNSFGVNSYSHSSYFIQWLTLHLSKWDG